MAYLNDNNVAEGFSLPEVNGGLKPAATKKRRKNMAIETLSSKRVQHYTQDIIAQTASNEPATTGEDIDWQASLNSIIKKDDKLSWFGLVPFLFSGVGKDEGGTTGDPSILEPSTPLTKEDAKVRLQARLQARLRWHNTLESAHSEAQLTYVVTSAMKSRENILTEPTLNRLADISDIRFIYAAAAKMARKHGWVGAAQTFAQKAEEITTLIEKLDPTAGSRVAEERQRFEALFPSGQTGFSAINLSDASAPFFQGADFFDNLFKPLTETPVKQPGADAFIAKVTELLGVRGKINSAMQEFRTATSPSLLGNSHINQPPPNPNNDANISLRVRTDPSVDLNVEVINLKERDFYLANGDPQGHETDNFQIMRSESLIVISQIYDQDGNPVAENKRETGKEYTEYEVRFNYDNNRLANVTLQKRTIVFAPDGVSITLKSSIGITHIHDEGINWFKLDSKGLTGKTNPAASEKPRGLAAIAGEAVRSFFLMDSTNQTGPNASEKPQLRFVEQALFLTDPVVAGQANQTGSSIPANALNPALLDGKGELRTFQTREELGRFLNSLGYEGDYLGVNEIRVLQDDSGRTIKVTPQMDGGVIYEVWPAEAFDKAGRPVDANALGEETNYNEYRIRYSFGRDGSSKGWDIRQVEIKTSPRQGLSFNQGVFTEDVNATTLSSSGDPIRDLQARDLEDLKRDFPRLKARFPQATDERLEKLAITAVKAWYEIPLETRQAEASRVLATDMSNMGLTDASLVHPWVTEAVEKRLQAESSEGLKTPGGTLKAYHLEAPVPEGAIDPVVLQGVEAIRKFNTLAELESHLDDSFGGHVEYKSKLGLPFRHWKIGDRPTTTSYETALGDTVVAIPSKNIFDASDNVTAESWRFSAHLADTKKLPPGDYSRFAVQYYFNPDGTFKGIAVERTTLYTRPRNFVDRKNGTVHHQDSIVTDRIASFGEPGWRLSAAERDKFVEEVSKRVAAVAEQLQTS